MKKRILKFTGCLLLTALFAVGITIKVQKVDFVEQEVPMASLPEKEEIITISNDNLTTQSREAHKIVNPLGLTLEERIKTPYGYHREMKEQKSFQGFLRQYPMKPDQSPVLLHTGAEKGNQSDHVAVFNMPLVNGDLQQCADSIMRIYGEYFWSIEAHDSISFHLTNGFLMDYPSWRDGKRLAVSGNNVSWVKKSSYDASYETFVQYLRNVMIYAGTLSLEKECSAVDINQIQSGDMFIKGGSPGHCVMVADVAADSEGNKCFLLAQSYMPAQEFHILKNPLHEEDPWYYVKEVTYPFITPEYVFEEGSFQRWCGFVNE